MTEASEVYDELTDDGRDRQLVSSLGLLAEGVYRYEDGELDRGRTLFDLAQRLTPTDPLISLQHSLIRRESEGRLIPPLGEFFRAVRACARRYAEVELLNDWRLCL